MNWKYLSYLLWGKQPPPIPNLREDREEELPDDGLTMGTLVIGKPGSGKTTMLANHLVNYARRYRDRAIFVLDWSGDISNKILSLLISLPHEVREELLDRTVFDDLGNPDWVIPMPEFSSHYGDGQDEQINRVRENWGQLVDLDNTRAEILKGVAYNGVAPAIFKVLTSIGERDCWQITEFGRLIDKTALITKAFRIYGARIPQRVRETINKRIINVKGSEEELRTYAFTQILSAIESPVAMPRLGYHTPGWTPKEAVERGQIVLVSGERLINQDMVQNYLFTQAFSLIMAEINKRTPADSNNKPVSIVLDETYALLQNKGISERIGMISPLYRSRKVQLYVVIQALWQLDEMLRQQIWSLGNVVCFGTDIFEDTYHLSQALFHYSPTTVKAVSSNRNTIYETDRGQYLTEANWIQGFANRECVVKRYFSEKEKDPFIRHIKRTKDVPGVELNDELAVVKDRLMRTYGVRVGDAWEVINRRTLDGEGPTGF